MGKYEEALERAKIIEKESPEWWRENQEAITEIFPELKESEDEKIRKEMIDFLNQFKEDGLRGVDITPWIAYLEKQKGQPTDAKPERVIKAARRVLNNWLDSCGNPDVSGDFAELEHAIRDYDGEEKQKEPQEVDLEKEINIYCGTRDIRPVPDFIDAVAHHFYELGKNSKMVIEKQKEQELIPDSIKFDEGFKTGREVGFREGVESVKPAGWSDEDRGMIQSIITSGCVDDKQERWLRMLPERISQPKQEWSEEDKRNIETLISEIENHYDDYDIIREEYPINAIGLVSWLKSLRHQTVSIENFNKFGQLEYERGVKDGLNQHWKPSEEQMEALLKLEETYVLDHERTQETARLYMVIKSLYEQLLKLRMGKDNAKLQENCLSNSKKLM